MKVVLKQPNNKPMRATAFFAVASPGPMTDLGDIALDLNMTHTSKDEKAYNVIMEQLKARVLHKEALQVSVSVGSYYENTTGSLFHSKPKDYLPMDGYPYMMDGLSAGIYMTMDELRKLLYAESILEEKMQMELRLVIAYEVLTGTSTTRKGIEFLTVSILDIAKNEQKTDPANNSAEDSCLTYRIISVTENSTKYVAEDDHVIFIPLMNDKYQRDYLVDHDYIESPDRVAWPSTMERFIIPWDI